MRWCMFVLEGILVFLFWVSRVQSIRTGKQCSRIKFSLYYLHTVICRQCRTKLIPMPDPRSAPMPLTADYPSTDAVPMAQEVLSPVRGVI